MLVPKWPLKQTTAHASKITIAAAAVHELLQSALSSRISAIPLGHCCDGALALPTLNNTALLSMILLGLLRLTLKCYMCSQLG